MDADFSNYKVLNKEEYKGPFRINPYGSSQFIVFKWVVHPELNRYGLFGKYHRIYKYTTPFSKSITHRYNDEDCPPIRGDSQYTFDSRKEAEQFCCEILAIERENAEKARRMKEHHSNNPAYYFGCDES